jgi:hypothetical protein
MELPEILTLAQLFFYLFIVAAADTIWNIALAIVHGNFSPAYVADFVRSHLILRVTAIGLIGSLGHGWPAFGIPEIPAASLAATAALAAYVIETIASMRDGLSNTTPVPSPPTPTPEG